MTLASSSAIHQFKNNVHVNVNYAEHLQIFTDGSKNTEDAVSAAMVIPERNVKIAKRLSNQLSIYWDSLGIPYCQDFPSPNRRADYDETW